MESLKHSIPTQGLSDEDIAEVYASITPKSSCKVCYGRGFSGYSGPVVDGVPTGHKIPCHKCVRKQFVAGTKPILDRKMADYKAYALEENKDVADGRTPTVESQSGISAVPDVCATPQGQSTPEAVHGQVREHDDPGEVRPQDSEVRGNNSTGAE